MLVIALQQALVLLGIICYIHARVYFVSQEQISVNERTGTWQKPFKTIQDCVNVIVNPGDECRIRKGFYHEQISVTGLNGKPNHPIVIKGYKDERPVLDGTIEIKPNTQWTNKGTGKIYRATIPNKIWQLFVNGEPMTNARWPNAKWSDKSIFNGTIWPGLALTSKRGLIVNKDRSLANTNVDMTGAMAVLNIGSFNTFVAKVKRHTAGSNRFTFEDTFGDYHFKVSRSRYFLEDKLELLDAPEEWYFDQKSSMLYVWTKTGENPSASKLRGKVQSYAMEITNCSHVILQNIDFFATALRASSSNSSYRANNITFHSLNFTHHTYSKRMLGDVSLIEWLDVDGIYDRRRKQTWGTFTFFNNTFYGSDGLPLSYHGSNVTISNNLFEYNDFTAANMVRVTGGMGTIKSDSIYDLFYRNTLRYNGASAGIRPGLSPRVLLNDVSKQCWGLIQNDGAGVQVTRKPQYSCTLEQNWVHDQPKYGLRFDGEPPKIGIYGTMSKNVVGRCNGMMVKGDHHSVLNNLAFEKQNANDDDKQGAGCALCVLKYVRTNPVSINNNTIVLNNIADVANGGKIIGKKGQTYPVAGSVVKNNMFGKRVTHILKDPHNFDYRPISSAILIGPYPFEANMKEYWIPGRQLYKTSSPVPPHQSKTVKAVNRDALMWLNGYSCTTHAVYFGTDEGQVKTAIPDSKEYIGDVLNGGNVAYLKETIRRGKTYFWRVDAISTDVNGNEIVYKGDVWNFKAI